MERPVLLVVDDRPGAPAGVGREMADRYGSQYEVACRSSLREARACLEEYAAAGTEVALVLAAARFDGVPGGELLKDVHHLHPHAMRSLLIEWSDWGSKAMGDEIFDGIAKGHYDNYVRRPTGSPDELFHQTITGSLLDWSESQRAAPYTVHVVGQSWSGRAHELRETLQQCAITHNFCLADSAVGRELVEAAGTGAELPIVVFPDGTVLENPSNAAIALAAGSPVNPETMDFDLVIVGAGPAGLSAAVYGASEGFATLVVDKGGIGGQATSSSLIRNYLGFASGLSGRQLARRAYDQAWVFGAHFAFMQTVTGLAREGDHLLVGLSDGGPVRTRAVLLAMGASYRRLDVPSVEALRGAGVYYGGTTSEAPGLAGRQVFIVGGANSAGQAALHLARYAERVTVVVRAASLRAGMSEYLVREIEATGGIDVMVGTEVVGAGGDERLEQLVLRDVATRAEVTADAQALFLMIGAHPLTDWVPPTIERDAKGFILTGPDAADSEAWPLQRHPFLLETSMPGVFAAGDVRCGAVKRVASAVGEGAIAVQFLHDLLALEPQQRINGSALNATS